MKTKRYLYCADPNSEEYELFNSKNESCGCIITHKNGKLIILKSSKHDSEALKIMNEFLDVINGKNHKSHVIGSLIFWGP